LRIGSIDPRAPSVSDWRTFWKRFQVRPMSTTQAQSMAMMIAQVPPTAAAVVLPYFGCRQVRGVEIGNDVLAEDEVDHQHQDDRSDRDGKRRHSPRAASRRWRLPSSADRLP
jgi:hypothetical protein